MKEVRWNALKNERLKRTRGLSFEELLEDRYLSTKSHPKRENQYLMLFERKGYIWVLPFVVQGEDIFLKTLYPSRSWTKNIGRVNYEKKNQADE